MAIHNLSMWLVGVVLLLCSQQAHSRNITNEDIRDGMMSLLHKSRAIEDKLERHEYREKAVGDQLKRLLTSLDKRHRTLEPLQGMISRLDERLSNVETILLQKEEREKAAQKKTNDALDAIQKTLLSLSTQIMENTKQTKNTLETENNLTLNEDSPLDRRLEATDTKIDTVKADIQSLNRTLQKDVLRSICSGMAYNANPLEKHITEAEKLLNRYELKLNEYNGTAYKTDIVPLNEVSLADEAWHNKMTEVMEKQEGEIKKIQKLLSEAESMWKELPKRTDLQTAANETLKAVATVAANVKQSADDSVTKIETKLREVGDRSVKTNEDIQLSLTQGNTLTERAFNDMARNYEDLRVDIKALAKSEDVLLQTADNVIATKKRVDYGVTQILMEISELVKIQARSMNRTLNDRFDNLEIKVIENKKNIVTNLTTMMETEMGQVWHQMGIVHQQLIASKNALDKLTNETEQYVNSSTTSMKEVDKKVTSISSRMDDLTSNLNFALGRLSMVSQEFSQISTGIINVLGTLKEDVSSVRGKIVDSGPGPHNITSEVMP